jgi:hypothetical protein
VRSQHPPTQWNPRSGRWSSAEQNTLKILKIPFKNRTRRVWRSGVFRLDGYERRDDLLRKFRSWKHLWGNEGPALKVMEGGGSPLFIFNQSQVHFWPINGVFPRTKCTVYESCKETGTWRKIKVYRNWIARKQNVLKWSFFPDFPEPASDRSWVAGTVHRQHVLCFPNCPLVICFPFLSIKTTGLLLNQCVCEGFDREVYWRIYFGLYWSIQIYICVKWQSWIFSVMTDLFL